MNSSYLSQYNMHSRSQHLQDMNCNHIIQRFYQFWYRNLICCVFRQDQKNILFRYGRTQVSKVCQKFWYPSFLQCLLYGKPEALYHYNADNITSYQIRLLFRKDCRIMLSVTHRLSHSGKHRIAVPLSLIHI